MNSFDEINKKIANFSKTKQRRKQLSTENNILVVCSEFFAGILVGGAVGYMLDSYFAIKPIMFLICLMFGIASSFLNIYNIMVKKK